MLRGLAVLSLALLSSPVLGGTFLVSSFADSGPDTLRQGILEANSGRCPAPCTIHFGLVPGQETAPRIELASPLPGVTADRVVIDSNDTPQPAPYPLLPIVEVIGGGAGAADGLRIEGARGVSINRISFAGFSRHGLVADHAQNLSIYRSIFDRNGGHGLLFVDTTGGGVSASTITRNQQGGLVAVRSTGLSVGYSSIGTDLLSSAPGAMLGNALDGIHLLDSRDSNVTRNQIRYNGRNGILVTGLSSLNNLTYNEFRSNELRAIEIDGGGVDHVPLIESAVYNRVSTRIIGTVMTQPNTLVRLQVHSVLEPDLRGFGEVTDDSAIHSEEVRGDSNGVASFTLYVTNSPPPPDSHVTVLATHLFGSSGRGETWEFSRSVRVVSDPLTLHVTTAADSGPGSLRDAIEEANGDPRCLVSFPCGISFEVNEPILPRSPLPAISGRAIWLEGQGVGRTVIDGSECGHCNGLAIVTNNEDSRDTRILNLAIRGFTRHGILVDTGLQYPAASIATCAMTSNGGSGVHVESGRAAVGYGSLIGGNAGHGISIAETGLVYVSESRIGTDPTGVQPFANGGSGIYSRGSMSVFRNTIAFNHEHGIDIENPRLHNTAKENTIHSNGGLALRLGGPPVLLPPVIERAHASGEETRITYHVDALRVPIHYGKTVTIYASSFADASGQAEGREIVATEYVESSKLPVRREITVKRNLAGKFLSANFNHSDDWSPSPYITTSEFSTAVQVTADSCPTVAPTVLEPASTAEVIRAATFRWLDVPGATEYRIWLMKRGDMPRIAHRGAAAGTTLQLEPGLYDWVVEARFGVTCYGTQSGHGLLRVN